jgi:outer membrane protein
MMRNFVLTILILIGLGAADAQAQNSIGTVSLDRIINESVPARAATTAINAEFSERGKELKSMAQQIKDKSDALEKSNNRLSPTEQARLQADLSILNFDFQRKQRAFDEDLSRRRNEEFSKIINRANKVIARIAEQQHYDLILQDAVYRSSRTDITDQVLKALAAAPTDSGADAGDSN